MERANSKLSLKTIFEIIWEWCRSNSISDSVQSTGVSKPTIIDWHNHLREVCLFIFQRNVQMGGPGKIVQIDESYFNGKRKNNKDRKLLYDKLKSAMDADQTGSSNFNVTRSTENNITTTIVITVNDENDNDTDDDDDDDADSGDEENNDAPEKYPWVFGLYEKRADSNIDVRLFRVKNRKAVTLLPIIQRHVAPGTEIWSDKWRAYNNLSRLGFEHKTVNHTYNFVDPTTKANTQRMECMWGHLKLKFIKNHKKTTDALFESHMAELWWRQLYGGDFTTTFKNIIKHISEKNVLN